jgi:transcriptional regulator with XRE-family HTH domain
LEFNLRTYVLCVNPELKKGAAIVYRLRVAELAYQRGWTMKQVAHSMQVDYATVLMWNKGKTLPRLERLLALGRLFGCDIRELLFTSLNHDELLF